MDNIDTAIDRLKTVDSNDAETVACCVNAICAASRTGQLYELIERIQPIVEACISDLSSTRKQCE